MERVMLESMNDVCLHNINQVTGVLSCVPVPTSEGIITIPKEADKATPPCPPFLALIARLQSLLALYTPP